MLVPRRLRSVRRAAPARPERAPGADATLRPTLDAIVTHAIVQTDPDGRITYWSRGAVRLTGFEAGDMLGQPFARLHAADDGHDAAPHRPPEAETARRREPTADERLLQRKDGSRFWAAGSVSPVCDARGRPAGWVHVFHDHTAARQARQDDRAARQEAERIARTKDEFIATLSHELRTPLNAILGWTHLLQRADQDAAFVRRALQVIERNAQVQSRLVNDLLDVSQMLSGKTRIHPVATNLEALADAAIETIHAAASERRIVVDKIVEGRMPVLHLDSDRMQQVLWNLLSNAVKFTPQGGRIEVRLATGPADCTVSVRDNGAGIRPDFLPFVFDRFSQADPSVTRQHGGLGLGLSIVQHLVELHGGRIRADSAGAGRGATFTVALPLSLAHTLDGVELPTGPARSAPDQAQAVPMQLEGLRVLVVDDEPDTGELVRQMLAEQGAHVLYEQSVEAALQTLADHDLDVLVSDIAMPGLSGYELVGRLRATRPRRNHGVAALALTSFGRASDRARAVQAGFQAYLSKPVEPAELVRTVAALATRRP